MTINDTQTILEGQPKLSFFALVQGQANWHGSTRPALVQFNRLLIGDARFQSSTHKQGLACTSTCECDALDHQIAAYEILECLLRRAPKEYLG